MSRLEAQAILAPLDLDSDENQLTRLLCLDDRSTRYRLVGGRIHLYWNSPRRLKLRSVPLCGRPFRQFQSRLLDSGGLGLLWRAHDLLGGIEDASSLALRGRIRQALSLWHLAADDLGRALRLEPGDGEAMRWLGETCVQLMDPEKGAHWLGRAIAAGDAGPWARAWLSQAFSLAGRAAGARRELDAALAMAPDSAELHVLAWSQGRPSFLRRARALAPRLRWALIASAHDRNSKGNLRGAEAELTRVIRADPSCFWALARRGQIRRRLGRRRACERDWLRAMRQHHVWTWAVGRLETKFQCEVYTTGADIYMAGRDLSVLDKRVRQDPDDPWVRSLRTLLYVDKKAADAEMEKVMALAPGSPYFKAFHAWRIKDDTPGQARSLIESAVERDPACGWLFARRGELRRRDGDLQGALEDFDRCIALAPHYWRAYVWRAAAMAGLGRAREALESAQRYVELYVYPQGEEPFYLMRDLRWSLGDRSGAFDAMDQAARLSGQPGWWRGFDADGRPELALEALGKPADPRSWLWRGECLARLGRRREAAESLLRAGEHPLALALLAELEFAGGRRGAALKLLDGALKRDPFLLRAYAARAAIRDEFGDVRKAAEDAEAWVALSATSDRGFAYMAELKRRAGFRSARRDLDAYAFFYGSPRSMRAQTWRTAFPWLAS